MDPETPQKKTTTAALLALALALGCSDPSPEQRIEDATQQVHVAEAEVADAEAALEREEQELAEAQEEIAEAREDLRAAERRLEEARQRVAEVADDSYLFRTVQSALLADRQLARHAVGARVGGGVVSLEGTVPSKELKQRAASLASAVPGVRKVENRMAVELSGP